MLCLKDMKINSLHFAVFYKTQVNQSYQSKDVHFTRKTYNVLKTLALRPKLASCSDAPAQLSSTKNTVKPYILWWPIQWYVQSIHLFFRAVYVVLFHSPECQYIRWWHWRHSSQIAESYSLHHLHYLNISLNLSKSTSKLQIHLIFCHL